MSIKVSKSMKLQPLPFHPFLVASFQILMIYSVNVNTANITVGVFVLLITVFFTALFFLLLSFIINDIKRAAILVTFYIFLFFTYGRLYDIFSGLTIAELIIGRIRYLIPLYALISIAGTFWIVRSQWCKKNLEGMTYFLNIFSFGLVIVAALVAITNFDWIALGRNKHIESNNFSIEKEVHQVSKSKRNIFKPNIYYIILDSYASHRVLKKYYDWDDSGVVEALRTRGFSVNKKAYSNYPSTDLSISATLNMRYIHEDRGFIDAISKEGYLNHKREQNEVMERFKSEGYDVVPGEYRSQSNRNETYRGYNALFSNEFFGMVVRVSILRIIEGLTLDIHRKVILNKLEDLKQAKVPNIPTFKFVHIVCPHPPFIFDPDGSKPNLAELLLKRRDSKDYLKKYYIEQVRFIGTQLIEIVYRLRRHDPRAVIIVQADHGYAGVFGTLSEKRPPIEFIDARCGILSAIYLSPGIMIPENITPVDLFRHLFNALFDAKLEILPDRAFFHTTDEPYAIYEITNDLKHLMTE